MTCCCNSNPAQYERNRRFRHLVHVLGRKANGAKLPSEGLGLNASKSESRLVIATIIKLPIRWEAKLCDVSSEMLLKEPLVWHLRRSKERRCLTGTYHMQCRGAKSFADDLVTGRGVVLSRAASTLRSVETYPPSGRFVSYFSYD
jgi:hypothetical protein